LSAADPCSLGFVSDTAIDQELETSAALEGSFEVSINNAPSTLSCVNYPLARKAYLNTIVGFENLAGWELEMAKCFSGAVVGGTTAFNNLLRASSLTPLPTGPVCQEFLAGSNACLLNPAPFPH
jgi:hypothetical protein